jgi:two-component system, OmpR family, response regulator QseB
MRILLVEDDDRIAKPVAEELRYHQHVVDIAKDGEEGWAHIQAVNYELILLDLMLPKLDGIALCRRIRAAQINSFVLMLTARDTTIDKITGLDAGADDYLVKPFELDELAARIRAITRRSTQIIATVLIHGDLQLDTGTFEVTYQDNSVTITPTEYKILEYFLHNPTQVLSKSQLLNQVLELDRSSGEETIKTHITNLRRKFKNAGAIDHLIETVYGLGYRLQPLTNEKDSDGAATTPDAV